VLVRITHLLRYPLDDMTAAEAVVEVGEAGPGAGRLFAPGVLPCGECPACRRGLVAICPARRTLIDASSSVPAAVEAPDRFLTPLDDLPGFPPRTANRQDLQTLRRRGVPVDGRASSDGRSTKTRRA
jgi:hypothetical protein